MGRRAHVPHLPPRHVARFKYPRISLCSQNPRKHSCKTRYSIGQLSSFPGHKILITRRAWKLEHLWEDVVLDAQGLPLNDTHSTRLTRLTFHIPHASVLHWLAGSFEARLYDEVGLSTHPERKDSLLANMLRWFPIKAAIRAILPKSSLNCLEQVM
ncbi:hypothetical protein BOTBODRAFT_32785 [Botryobasidium botryosum FD-172 SS1]|uniref:PRMT5 oligomerisation domain-containing protein n=1 Tax=Botryobasidium botryosum (strain FD-172 SS1) TaxID=930990 RepID=A0A067MI14_BOTB1|nr:hypothetical protein BOTBODRAFT_32785 [Botryobasidium botryosum FD-172 SS1]